MRKDGYVTKSCTWCKREHSEKRALLCWVNVFALFLITRQHHNLPWNGIFLPISGASRHSLMFPDLLWPFLTFLDFPWLAAPSSTFPDLLQLSLTFFDLLWPSLTFFDFSLPFLTFFLIFFDLHWHFLIFFYILWLSPNFFNFPWFSLTFFDLLYLPWPALTCFDVDFPFLYPSSTLFELLWWPLTFFDLFCPFTSPDLSMKPLLLHERLRELGLFILEKKSLQGSCYCVQIADGREWRRGTPLVVIVTGQEVMCTN